MKKIVFLTFILLCMITLFSCSKSANKQKEPIMMPVTVYIDGAKYQSVFADESKGYTITPPEKPEDITINSDIPKYFYGWFEDPNFQSPLSETTRFPNGGAIYGKWITADSTIFEYTVDYGKATITGFKGVAPEVLIIPSFIDPFPVTGIKVDAFLDNKQIEIVAFCNGIENITGFYGCTAIKKVYIPKSVKSIGIRAFRYCSNLQSVTFEENSQCKSIGAAAFSDSWLCHIEIPNTVQSIESNAFFGCSFLKTVTIPNSVRSIGSSAFEGCSALQYNIYGNASYLGNSSNPYLYLVKTNTADLTSCAISSQTKFIGDSAFEGCLGTSITIPEGVISIGCSAFKNCRALTSIIIPEGVTSIGYSAFENCQALTSIIISNSVNSIELFAFKGCINLEKITIPNSVKHMGDMVFYGWKSYQKIYCRVESEPIGWSSIWSRGCYADIYWNK